MKIQKLYEEFKKAEAVLDRKESEFELAWTAGAPEMDALEAETDRYYEEVYHPALQALTDEIRHLTGVDVPTARKMIEMEKFASLMGMEVTK